MLIIKTKKDILQYIKSSPVVVEVRDAYEEDQPDAFKEVEEELISLLAGAKEGPDFGEDWESWLKDNISEMLEEAISIVM
jgi:hypothetical protein